MTTICRRFLVLIGSVAVGCTTFAQSNSTLAIKEHLYSFLTDTVQEPALYKTVCLTGRVEPHQLKWAMVDEKQLVTCCIKRVPAELKLPARKSLVNGMLVTTLLHLQSVHSPEFKQMLSHYQYADILVDYARDRLVQKMSGEIFGLPVSTIYADSDHYILAFVRLPEDAVITSTIKTVSSDDATLFYKTALIRAAKQKMATEDYEEAVRFMLEAFKFGYVAEGLFMDLFTCYVSSGHTEDGLRTSQLLLERYGKELSFDNCVEMARVAESGAMPECADAWYQQAEQRLRRSLNMDSLVDQ